MNTDITDKIHEEFSKFPKRSYPKGQILVFAGDNPKHIFYITKGRVRKYDVSYRGDEVVVNVFKPPAFFPMSWAINQPPNKFFYKTETATELHVVPPDTALEFLKANPDVMLDLLGRIYNGTEGLLGRMVQLMAGTARDRLIYELIVECRRFGEKLPDGSFKVPTNGPDLAARTGLTRETISREINKLKKTPGVGIEIESKYILVSDLDALQKQLEQE
jgi:CRP-like cAMP-binding protein